MYTYIMKWGFNNFAKVIVSRQIAKQSDTFIVIYGKRRTGKTTLMFKILESYLREMRRLYKAGESEWFVSNKWSDLFKRYFAMSCSDMTDKLRNNPERSVCVVDEGIDVMSWKHQMEKEQTELTELILKAGKKKNLIIFITPSLKLLTKSILSNAHYLFFIPNEHDGISNTTYLFRNYEDAIRSENIPFGFHNIQKTLLKNKYLGRRDRFASYLKRQDRYMLSCQYRPTRKDIYELYDKMVKEPFINADKNKKKYVTIQRYQKIQYALDTIFTNLYQRDGKKIAQIEQLMIDKFGTKLATRQTIKSHIDKIIAIQEKPKLHKDPLIQTPEKQDYEEALLEE